MSVFLPNAKSKTYIYDFWYQGRHYKDSTHQRTRVEAELVEAQKKLELRAQSSAGFVPAAPLETPTFSIWAEVTLEYLSKFIARPDLLTRTMRMILAFWGAAPAEPQGQPAVPRAESAPRPYHNLRLGDPIADPSWLERFEAWMTARGIGGSTRNSYLSACADLYTCALQPMYRSQTGIAMNPFAGIRRSVTRKRIVAMSPDKILALVGEAERHISHALCIAALAPKLRETSILRLQWARDVDPDLTQITIDHHKTSRSTGLAQVVPVSVQLRAILLDIRTSQGPGTLHVITWRGRPVQSIKKGLRRAVEAVGLTWGLKAGVTFHVMRHSIATILANPNLVGALTERLRADVMGHHELRTTQQYTHLSTSVQAGPHELLSAVLPNLRDRIAQKPTRKVRGQVRGPLSDTEKIIEQNRVLAFTAPEMTKRAI